MSVKVRPVTAERWEDLARLFGPRGAYANCWCMWWRMPSRAFDRTASGTKRASLRRIVRQGREPGLIAYLGSEPVGWVSVAPREEFARLERSPTLKRVDARPVWSVVCFFIARPHRGGGVARALLEAAVDHAARAGATILEAYPVDPADRAYPASEAYTGLLPMFEEAGFREVARRGRRPVVRRSVRRGRRREPTRPR